MNKVDTIEWHQECLKNSKATCESYMEDLKVLNAKINKIENKNAFYEFQINEAIREKRESFDGERYRVKRIKLNK